MDDIKKDKVYRFLQNFNLRILKADQYKFPYDRQNFVELENEKDLSIFDVGANIGQSSIWFATNFPKAKIYSFEPYSKIFNYLKNSVSTYKSIQVYQLAISNSSGYLKMPQVENPLCQTNQVLELAEESLRSRPTEDITLITLDEFCEQKSVEKIHILKTDTEGYDISVLEGAQKLFKEHRILNVLSEASIVPTDKQHTNFFRLYESLSNHGFELFSCYDLNHDPKNGRLRYFNALFKKIR